MAKDKQEKIRACLRPKELVAHVCEPHVFNYFFPIAVIIAGLALNFFQDLRLIILFEGVGAKKTVMSIVEGMQGVFFGIWIVVAGIVILIQTYIHKKTVVQMVTSLRVVEIKGITKLKIHEVYISQIKTFKMKRTMFNYLMHRGDIIITSNDDELFLFENISAPEKFYAAIKQSQGRLKQY